MPSAVTIRPPKWPIAQDRAIRGGDSLPKEKPDAVPPGAIRAAGLRHLRKARREAGFSLVEVSLALGIIAIAFVALLGLIPIGLGTSANAIDATVQTQIVQRLTTVARQAKYSELSQLNRNTGKANNQEDPDFYFDEEGTEVRDSAAIAEGRYVYTAAVVLVPVSRVPDGTAVQSQNPNLATLNFIVKRVSAVRDARTSNVLIANNGL